MNFSRYVALAAALALGLGGAAHATTYSGLFIFGDSLSDSGNNALVIGADPTQVITGAGYIAQRPYASGTYSNGAVWSQQFAAQMGLSALPSLAGGGNYASGGARLEANGPGGFPFSMSTQVGQFLGGHGGIADPNALYVISGGGPDLNDALTAVIGGADPGATTAALAASYATTMGQLVDNLQAAGARHIVVWNAPNAGLTPSAGIYGDAGRGLATSISAAMNAALDQRLAFEGGDVKSFDLFGLLGNVAANPAAYGFTDVTTACGAVLGCDASTALFWDGIHPTTFAHGLLAHAMIAAAVPEPATYALWLIGLGGLALLKRRRA